MDSVMFYDKARAVHHIEATIERLKKERTDLLTDKIELEDQGKDTTKIGSAITVKDADSESAKMRLKKAEEDLRTAIAAEHDQRFAGLDEECELLKRELLDAEREFAQRLAAAVYISTGYFSPDHAPIDFSFRISELGESFMDPELLARIKRVKAVYNSELKRLQEEDPQTTSFRARMQDFTDLSNARRDPSFRDHRERKFYILAMRDSSKEEVV